MIHLKNVQFLFKPQKIKDEDILSVGIKIFEGKTLPKTVTHATLMARDFYQAKITGKLYQVLEKDENVEMIVISQMENLM